MAKEAELQREAPNLAKPHNTAEAVPRGQEGAEGQQHLGGAVSEGQGHPSDFS